MNEERTHDRLLTVAEAAAQAHVSTKTIYRAIEARRLRHSRIGQTKGYRIRLGWLDEWIDDCSVEVLPSSGFEIARPTAPPQNARSGPYAPRQTPRRGTLK